MKKIYLSIFAVFIVLILVTGAAYSLFFSTSSISGITFSTGTAGLLVGDGESFDTSWSPGNYLFENLIPGGSVISRDFSLKNNSSSDISMYLSVKLGVGYTETSDNSWDELKEVIQIRIVNNIGTSSSWHTLDNFSTTGINFDTGLAQNEHRDYKFEVKLSDTATNSSSGKGIHSVSIVFTGEQQ